MKFIIFSIFIGLFFPACTSSTSPSYNSYIYKGINFGLNRNEAFKKGVHDGCTTASGVYTKNHEAFNQDRSYRDGWGDGRLLCHNKG